MEACCKSLPTRTFLRQARTRYGRWRNLRAYGHSYTATAVQVSQVFPQKASQWRPVASLSKISMHTPRPHLLFFLVLITIKYAAYISLILCTVFPTRIQTHEQGLLPGLLAVKFLVSWTLRSVPAIVTNGSVSTCWTNTEISTKFSYGNIIFQKEEELLISLTMVENTY